MSVSTTVLSKLNLAPAYLSIAIMTQGTSTLDAIPNNGLNVRVAGLMPPSTNCVVPSSLGIVVGGMQGSLCRSPNFVMMRQWNPLQFQQVM